MHGRCVGRQAGWAAHRVSPMGGQALGPSEEAGRRRRRRQQLSCAWAASSFFSLVAPPPFARWCRLFWCPQQTCIQANSSRAAGELSSPSVLILTGGGGGPFVYTSGSASPLPGLLLLLIHAWFF